MKKITATAIEIVNYAVKQLGMEATIDYKLKDMLILVVDACIRKGYVNGYKDAIDGKPPKTTQKDIDKFKSILK